MKNLKNLIFILLVLLLGSCMGIKPGSRNSVSKLYESFFAGQEGMQYFIKPLEFRNNNKEKLLVDFTFRYRNEIRDSVIVNVSVVSEKLIRNFHLLEFSSDSNIANSDSLNFFLSSIKGNQITSRFSTKIHLKEIVGLFKNSDWIVKIESNTINSEFSPTRATKKNINRLNQNLFILFRD